MLVAEAGELHEDDAAVRLAKAVAGSGMEVRGPNQSRIDLVAAVPGVVNVRIAELERINRLDPLEVFTVFDGQIVDRGDLVASIKVAPHVVEAAIVDEGVRITDFGSHPIVWVAPFVPSRVGVIVKESVRATARERFEASVRAKVEGLGSLIVGIEYVEDDVDAVEDAMARFTGGDHPVDLVLTAGAASTDPQDAVFAAIATLGGRVVRRGVPAHPGSMLWLARVGGTAILGPADVRGVLEGDGRRPAAPAAPLGRAGLGADRGEARPRRHPHALPAVPLPGLRPRARRARWLTRMACRFRR